MITVNNTPANNDTLISRIKAIGSSFGGQSATLTQAIKDGLLGYGLDGLPLFLTYGYKACPEHARPVFWNTCRVILGQLPEIKQARLDGQSLQVEKRTCSIVWKRAQQRAQQSATVNNSQLAQQSETVNNSQLAQQSETVNFTVGLFLPKPLIDQMGDIIAQLSEHDLSMAQAMIAARLPQPAKKSRGKKAA